jgi:hypothetical protein
MRNLTLLFIHFIAVLARLLGPGGVRSVVAESLLLKHQLLIVNRSRQRSPNLSALDRILAGWMTLWVRPTRLLRSAIALKLCLANCYGELILPVIALRKWAESHFGDAPNRSETTGPAKHAPMEKHRMISWKSCRG